MSLHILSDADVRSVLASVDKTALNKLCDTLGAALYAYSNQGEKEYQCHRQGVTRPGGSTMLFMPATLADGSSVKVVGVPPPAPADVGPDYVPKAITGVVMISDADGRATGVLNAAALTAFRTSLGAIILYRYRLVTKDIVVFGAGKQAQWHLYLSLVLRRPDISSITIVNRSAARAESLITELHTMGGSPADLAHIKFTVVAPTDTATVKAAVQQADVIYCTTPSTEPVFPADWVDSDVGRKKSRFISAIGSYKLDMQEIDPALLRAVATDKTYPEAYFPGAVGINTNGGVILVDSRDACAAEAGELVNAGIPESHILETGELLKLQEDMAENAKKQSYLTQWLARGNVIYKSVGIGIMDLCIGRALLKMGADKSIGTTIPSF
ncbi:ornithine cyclodeaminase mu-crystallin family protein [Ophiostoma piceae UAMH 11346]|uniref:Ornithine cyclodeaminase mu-crystallin family protein n=1 Tax=Ophiostoma piceae (strain UAMH 11346) TaxID=1262450 RepID=S3CTX2_OPHP1|nr:ornithine cyclodeaminase mu-crystallin family protein [Ophiostoma piceae UAMH 11346]